MKTCDEENLSSEYLIGNRCVQDLCAHYTSSTKRNRYGVSLHSARNYNIELVETNLARGQSGIGDSGRYLIEKYLYLLTQSILPLNNDSGIDLRIHTSEANSIKRDGFTWLCRAGGDAAHGV